jgi:hypothetical protein
MAQFHSTIQRRLDAIRTSWQSLINGICDPYRPELHYMRGPGPKWHAKHRSQIASGAI